MGQFGVRFVISPRFVTTGPACQKSSSGQAACVRVKSDELLPRRGLAHSPFIQGGIATVSMPTDLSGNEKKKTTNRVSIKYGKIIKFKKS